MGSCGFGTWAITRIILYLAIVVAGLMVAGLIGTTKSGHGTCLLSTKMKETDISSCQGAKCSSNSDCPSSYTCSIKGKSVEKHCYPKSCYTASGSDSTANCSYVIGFSAVAGCMAGIFLIINVIKLCKSDMEEQFKAGNKTGFLGFVFLLVCLCACASGAVLTVGFNNLCGSINSIYKEGQIAYPCPDSHKDFVKPDGGFYLPDFYTKFQISIIAAWVVAIGWFVLFVTSCLRYCGHRRSLNKPMTATIHNQDDRQQIIQAGDDDVDDVVQSRPWDKHVSVHQQPEASPYPPTEPQKKPWHANVAPTPAYGDDDVPLDFSPFSSSNA